MTKHNDSTATGFTAGRRSIAVVGASALFPGSTDAAGFWRDILSSKDLLSDVPDSHWLIEDYYDADPKAPDKTYAKRGGFLDKVDFDALGFGIPPSIMPATDTAQLLALIVARKVLEDAWGSQFMEMDKSRMSCILGVTSAQELLNAMVSRLQKPVWVKSLRDAGLSEDKVQEVAQRIGDHYTPWQEATFPGLLGNVVAGRIANRLDLGGTNCVTDAACASTFSALHMAVNELYLGDSDMVIAGGVDTMNDIFMYMCFSKTPALSAKGDCRPFSDQADGTMLGEGMGMVALKRLEDAERDGDRVYAVVEAVGSSSDGRSKSVYAPVSEGQSKSIRRAWKHAGFDPSTVELVEAHGTGTKAGDVAEFGGLRLVFEETERHAAGDRQWCALGTVKSQIGHTKAAAGAAGLFKAVMALHHKTLPPTAKVDKPNPKLEIEQTPFYLNTKARPWVRGSDHPRRAGVSSFGFGGSNFHVALQEYTGPNQAERLRTWDTELVTLSADSAEALITAAEALAQTATDLRWEAWHSSQQAPGAHRLALLARDLDDLRAKLGRAADRIAKKGKAFSTPDGSHYDFGTPNSGKVAFLFPGQGSQYLSMGAEVAIHLDAARTAWDAAADVEMTDADAGIGALHEVVFPVPGFSEAEEAAQLATLTQTEWAQPAIGAASQALLGVAHALGLSADHVAGHSYGEVTALHAAGLLSAEDMLAVARKRGELMAEAAQTPGSMLAVAAPVEEVTEKLEAWGLDVVVANHNHPTQVVLSGTTPAIEDAEARFVAAEMTAKKLNVATAFHSPVVSASAAPFTDFLAEIDLGEATATAWSNSQAAPYDPADGDALRSTLGGAIAEPVRFVEMIEGMYEAGVRTFVEVGPGNVLTKLSSRILRKKKDVVAVDMDRKGRGGLQSLLDAVARLWVAGQPLELSALWTGYRAPLDPAEVEQPKLAVAINGTNVGKPYPPEGGAAALPRPNPSPVTPEAAPKPAPKGAAARLGAPDPVRPGPTPAPRPSPAPQAAPAARPTPAQRRPASQPAQSAWSLPTPTFSRTSSQAAAPAAAQDHPMSNQTPNAAWLAAFQEMQRQTAEAHASFQQAMAESHAAYLKASETSIMGLASMAGGVPAPQWSAQPALPAPAPQAAAPAPVPQAAAPAPVPAQPAWSAPVPQAAAPPAAAPPAAAPAPAPQAAAPAPAPAPAAAPAAGVDLNAVMLEVVAEKTGYPAEMLSMDMDLEGDLGVDSIKRVEILSAMKEKVPGLPEVDPAELGSLRTLGEIADRMGAGAAPAAAPVAPAAAPAAGVDLNAVMLEVVAEKTGYPAEMLSMDMDLEGDLGVDSIKRVEILSAMKEKVPGLPEVDPAELGSLRTLGEIADRMGAGAAPAAAPAAPVEAAASTSVDLQATMLEVVAEKTGYPAEMLSMDMDLEGDLGVDSIKRVEILSAMKERVPDLPEVEPSELATLRTLGQIVAHLAAAPGFQAGTERSADDSPEGDLPGSHADPRLGRFVLRAVPQPRTGLTRPLSLQGPVVLVCPDLLVAGADEVIEVLADRLAVFAGSEVMVATDADAVPADAGAVVLLHGLGHPDQADELALSAFQSARRIAPAFTERGGLLVTVQGTGGDFGLTDAGDFAWLSGMAGLARTAAQEWPAATIKAVDLSLDLFSEQAEEVGDWLAEEILSGGPELEVGLDAEGLRVVLQDVREAVQPGAPVLGSEDVVVVSGGAKGVTAACMIELARATGARFLLLGRTALTDEPACVAGIEGDAALKKALLQDALGRGEKPNPRDLGNQVWRIQGNREIRGTLEAIAAAGGQARYASVDVTDADALQAALDEVRAAWGPITGLVHGAGVLRDKTIADKSDDDFARVWNTKIHGLQALLGATADDSLAVLVTFSSVAARCGNNGQVDYAMANEVLNKVTAAYAAAHPGCVAKSLGWGPWEGGMVTPALKARFEALGVPLIPLDVGARMLVDELSAGREDVTLVLGGKPRVGRPLASEGHDQVRYEVEVSAARQPWLADHSIQGTPVVPVVLAVEWFARAAAAFRTDLHLASVEEIKVLSGIKVEDFEGGLTLTVEVRQLENGTGALLGLALLGPGGRRHYSAVARMTEEPELTTAVAARPTLGTFSDEVYGGVLFHGPAFQVIREVEGISDQGMAARLSGVVDQQWQEDGWQTDVAAMDGALQLALLWTKHELGGHSLPTSVGRVRLGRVPRGGVRAVLQGRSAQSGKAVSDLVLVDESGATVAALDGVETHLLPSA